MQRTVEILDEVPTDSQQVVTGEIIFNEREEGRAAVLLSDDFLFSDDTIETASDLAEICHRNALELLEKNFSGPCSKKAPSELHVQYNSVYNGVMESKNDELKAKFSYTLKELQAKSSDELIALSDQLSNVTGDPQIAAYVSQYRLKISEGKSDSYVSTKGLIDLIFLTSRYYTTKKDLPVKVAEPRRMPSEIANKIRSSVSPEVHNQPQQMYFPFSPLPTEMCRVSPFFPINKNDVRSQPFLDKEVITSSSWGKITFTGKRLSTFHEDYLLAILALLDLQKFRRYEKINNTNLLVYRGPFAPVFKLATGEDRNPSATDYEYGISLLGDMVGAVFDMEVFGRDSRKKRKIKNRHISNILNVVFRDEDTNELVVGVNPYFSEMYFNERVTFIDVLQRALLGSPVAKSLKRFIDSQGTVWEGHFMTIAASMNLNINEQPVYQIRRQIKDAIKKLIDDKTLLPVSGFSLKIKDVVHLEKPAKTTRRKLLAIQGKIPTRTKKSAEVHD